MNGWMLLLPPAQVVLAIAGLTALKGAVLPALEGPAHRDLIADVWGPLALVVPLLVWAIGIRMTVTGGGWIPVGGPICVGVFLVGSALLVGHAPVLPGTPPRLIVALGGSGLVVLLLAAAHDLTIWTGQVIFALAAVLLWINTPDEAHRAPPPAGATRRRDPVIGPGLGAALVLACGLGQGACALAGAASAPGLHGLLLVAYGLGGAMLVAVSAGAAQALRIGGWAAALGALLGVGTMSVAHLAPQAAAIVMRRPVEVQTHVAHGFGIFVLEGALLLVLAAALSLGTGLGMAGRRALGAVLIAAAAVAAAADMADIWLPATTPLG